MKYHPYEIMVSLLRIVVTVVVPVNVESCSNGRISVSAIEDLLTAVLMKMLLTKTKLVSSEVALATLSINGT